MNLFLEKILKKSQKRTIFFANVSWIIFTRIVTFLLRFSVVILMTRYLGPEDFGVYSYIIAYVALFEPLADLGINQLVISELSKTEDKNKKSSLLSLAFILRIASSLCAMILYLFGTLIIGLDKEDSNYLFLVMGLTLLLKPLDFTNIWLVSEYQQKRSSIASILSVVVSSLSRIIAIVYNASLEIFGLIFFAEALTLSLILLVQFFYYQKSEILLKRINLFKYKWLVVNSFFLALSGIATFLYMKVDQIMLGQMIGTTSVGLYSAAVKLSESWYIIPAALAQSALPFLSKEYQTQSEKYYHRLSQLMKVIVATGYIVALCFSIFGDDIIEVVYGFEFQQASILLKLHSWSGVFIGLDLVRNIWLINANQTKLSFKFALVGAFANILLNIILIPKYQALGATIATLISYILSTYLCCFYFSKSRKIAFLMSRSLILR